MEKMNKKKNILAMVSNLYYNLHLTQKEIADRLFLSRSQVSRMLEEARQEGIVEIHIKEPWERNTEIERLFQKYFSLRNVRVISSKALDQEMELSIIAEVVTYYLDAIIQKGMIIGLSWGNTLYHIVKCIAANSRKNIPIMVVPIMGAAYIKCPQKDALDLAKDLALAYGGNYQYLYAPLFVNNEDLKKSLLCEKEIADTLSIAKRADVILSSVGAMENGAWNHYLSEEELNSIQRNGAVGHIGGHFYNIEGKMIQTSLDERMIGVEVEDLKKCEEVICVVCGREKADAALGALRGAFIDTLIIDENCAKVICEKICL